MEKKVLYVLNYLSMGGLFLSIVSWFAVMIDFQPIFGGSFTYNDVFASALISISATGIRQNVADEIRRDEIKSS